MRLALLALPLAVLAWPALAQDQPSGAAQIVVEGRRVAEPISDWRQAETEHVVVVGDASAAEIGRIAHNLEKLHFLLSVLLDRVDRPDETVKLRVTLFDQGPAFEALRLKSARWQRGPYPDAFPTQLYYDPREDGAVLAGTRADAVATLRQGQRIDLTGLGGVQLNPMTGQTDAQFVQAGSQELAVTANGVTIPFSGEGRLYAGFAEHFLLTYFPNAYPRWYLEGFGEIFSTFAVRKDGALEYGRQPTGYRQLFDWYRPYPIAQVIDGRWEHDKRARLDWTPYHAWALAHLLFFSDAWKAPLHDYLAAIAEGRDPAEAAHAFGDVGKLEAEFRSYNGRKVAFETMTYPADRAQAPLVRQMTRSQAAAAKARLEMAARVELPVAAEGGDADEARARAVRERERWLADLRADTAREPASRDRLLLLAEAECRAGNADRCLAGADQALKLAPNDPQGLTWRGSALLQQALAATGSDRASRLRAARSAIARANRMDPDMPEPLLAYYRSFADAGEDVPDVALQGLAKASESVPPAPTPRLMLGTELARRGDAIDARRALLPVANGAFETPEQPQARQTLATLPSR